MKEQGNKKEKSFEASLERLEKKVEMITKKANGTIETQEFPSSEEARPGDEGPEESLLAEEESPQGQIEQEEQPLF
jgi:hypothetical protein